MNLEPSGLSPGHSSGQPLLGMKAISQPGRARNPVYEASRRDGTGSCSPCLNSGKQTAHFPHCCNLLQVLARTVPVSAWHPNVWGLEIYNWNLKEPPVLSWGKKKKKVERLSCKHCYLHMPGNLQG